MKPLLSPCVGLTKHIVNFYVIFCPCARVCPPSATGPKEMKITRTPKNTCILTTKADWWAGTCCKFTLLGASYIAQFSWKAYQFMIAKPTMQNQGLLPMGTTIQFGPRHFIHFMWYILWSNSSIGVDNKRKYKYTRAHIILWRHLSEKNLTFPNLLPSWLWLIITASSKMSPKITQCYTTPHASKSSNLWVSLNLVYTIAY